MANIRVLTKLDNLDTNDIVTDSLVSSSLYIDQQLLHINKNSNRIGIKTNNPQHDLHVLGTFAAKTKSFVIPHPLDPENKFLRYGSLESPYHGVRLTGQSQVVDGYCKVVLPNYISKLVKQEDSSVQLTNYQHSKILFVHELNINNNFFIVASDCYLTPLQFFWSFTAIRIDVPDMEVEFLSD